MDVKSQKFFVLGVSKSGVAAAEFILNKGGECFFYEELQSPKIEQAISKLTELGGKKVDNDNVDEIMDKIDVLVISPGAPINHRLAVLAKQKGKRIVGELEFGFLQFNPTTVAVTGTNGKTTTATLIDAMLKECGRKSLLVGNVGVPITAKVNECSSGCTLVTEVSSFQLEGVNSFCPHISCVLNISPDHLERHYTMDNYVFLKKRIFKNQKESEFVVLNYDDLTVRNFAQEIKAKVVWVSIKEKVDGAYMNNGRLYFYDEYIIDESRLKLKGEHNVYDTLFAITCAKLLGENTAGIVNALEQFKGVRHRMEFVENKDGVNYYNDSKATNTASTMNAINVLGGQTILILGGSEKGESYAQLFEKIKQLGIKHVVITGASRFNMLDAASKIGYYETTVTTRFDDAVNMARLLSANGDNVLLSPACASFDSFSGYEERGERFVKIVGEW